MPKDPLIAEIARDTKVIAIVGLSPREDRPSWGVGRYLQSQGYRIVPVNPGHAGSEILGERVYPDLESIPEDLAVDMVDIFRRAEAVPGIVEAAMAHLPQLRTIWMQLGIAHESAAQTARAAGLRVIEDRCPKIEFARLAG